MIQIEIDDVVTIFNCFTQRQRNLLRSEIFAASDALICNQVTFIYFIAYNAIE